MLGLLFEKLVVEKDGQNGLDLSPKTLNSSIETPLKKGRKSVFVFILFSALMH